MVGKLIVIEGADASGKATQAKRLVKKLEGEGQVVELISFPRYETFSGSLVKKYLSGEFGSIEELPPEFPSLLYALDRYDAAKSIKEALAGSKIVVADRYTASNIAHQAAKLPVEKQAEFIDWIESVESRLPKPVVTIYLDVPVDFSQKLMHKQGREKDLHEKNVSYLESVRGVYLQLAEGDGWQKIDCVKGDKLLSIDEIHELVWAKVKTYL